LGFLDYRHVDVVAEVIAVKMITGDHLLTARAIAGQIGLKGQQENGQLVALSGRDLEKVPDESLHGVAERTAVLPASHRSKNYV
jgi:magnesium-transporting ATPase (P-type)